MNITEQEDALIKVSQIEVKDGHHTLWVHAPDGSTTLRIKCTGKINIRRHCIGPAHGDIMVDGDIDICIPKS